MDYKKAFSAIHRKRISDSLRAKNEGRTHKVCQRCKSSKPVAEFGERRPGLLESYCITCKREYQAERQRKYYGRHPHLREKTNLAARRANLKRHYGITPECYDEMLASQRGICAICGADKPGGKRKYFCVDHDHSTGKVRGLLCNTCNRALGLIGDSIESLSAAVDYLRRHASEDELIIAAA